MHPVPAGAGLEPEEQHQPDPGGQRGLRGAASRPAIQHTAHTQDEYLPAGGDRPDPLQQTRPASHGVHPPAAVGSYGGGTPTVNSCTDTG